MASAGTTQDPLGLWPTLRGRIGFPSVSLECGRGGGRGRSAHLSFPAVVYVRVPAVHENFPDGGLLFSVGGVDFCQEEGGQLSAALCCLIAEAYM
jgi:hypothetical protein